MREYAGEGGGGDQGQVREVEEAVCAEGGEDLGGGVLPGGERGGEDRGEVD